jgi:chemotaxis signal transduction protein
MNQTERLGVLFHLGPHRFALPSDGVIEICEGRRDREAALTWRHRGRDHPLVDLRRRFSLPRTEGWAPIILVKAPGDKGGIALQVDGIEAIAPIRADTMIDIPEPLRGFLGEEVEGFWIQSLPAEDEEAKRIVRLVLREEALAVEPLSGQATEDGWTPGESLARPSGGTL